MAHLQHQVIRAGIICVLMSACIPYYGPRVSELAPATRPAGIASVIDLGGDPLQAEVLALEEDALIVLVDRVPQHAMAGRLARIPFAGIRTAEFASADDFEYNAWTFLFSLGPPGPPGARSLVLHDVTLDAETHERLRLLSRYPQGLNAELLARLEGVYGDMETLDLEAISPRSSPRSDAPS